MSALHCTRTRIALSGLAVALCLAIGCTDDKTTVSEPPTGARNTPIVPPSTPPKTQSGAPETTTTRPLEDLKNDLKPPVVVKPGPSPDTGTAPSKP